MTDKFPPYNPYPDRRKDYYDGAARAIEIFLPFETFTAIKKITFDRLFWAVTEAEGKYNLRYWSEGAVQHYQKCQQCQQKLKEFSGREKELGITLHSKELQHEHVHTKKDLIQRLFSGDPIQSVVCDAVACVVTKAEHGKLDRTRRGWERYTSARVKVYDLLHNKVWLPRNEQKASDKNKKQISVLNPREMPKDKQMAVIFDTINFARTELTTISGMIFEFCLNESRKIHKKFAPEYSSAKALHAEDADIEYLHVNKRLDLMKRLKSGESTDSVVADTFVCSVTKDEFGKLQPHRKFGWQSYCNLGIDVLKRDSETGQWVDFIKDGEFV